MNEILEELKKPFHPSRITWKPGSIKGDKTKAMALAYADLRAYQDRLDEICGMDWAVTYTPCGDKLICHVTINGITRSSTGEPTAEAERNEIDGTVTEAQAMKRACAQWGLGRYLYDLPTMWVEWDNEHKRFTDQGKARLTGMIAQHYDRYLKETPLMVDVSTGEILLSQQNAPQRTQPQQSSNHTAQHRTTSQRPAHPVKANPVPEDENFYPPEDNPFNDPHPFVWPTSDDALEICAGYRETLADSDASDMIDKWREKNQSSNAPLSIQNKDGKGGGQYGAMAGKLGTRYGKGSHAAILSAICGRVVSRENPPGWKLKELLDLWDTGGLDVSVFDSFVEVLKGELQNLEVA